MLQRSALLVAVLALSAVTRTSAQVNDKGTFHASIGIAAGGHATHYEQTTLGIVHKDDDGAATVTYPIEFGYGLGKRFSLGLFLEPGVYLDSSASASNGLASFGLQPRFYLIDGDRFTWMASLQLGSTRLRYDVDEPGNKTESVYSGGFFGLSTGVGFYFSDLIGLNLQLRYMSTAMPLKEWSINGTSLDPDLIDAKLSTNGVALQASLAFKF